MIVATAGHVDHGKTALVRALTGVDADRLPEEKRRGLTIDLGFAYRDGLGFVDVPGHERFVHNMLAGVAGIDLALLVVAADDGPMPQTREHLAIVRLLGVPRIVVALSKVDRVAPARVEEVARELRALVPDARRFPLSALTGEGVGALEAYLRECDSKTAARAAGGNFRLAVDRAFTLAGVGLVVTGTAMSGEVAIGAPVRALRSGATARVRSIHAHNARAERGRAGQRIALNLAGIDGTAPIARGDWIVGGDAPGGVRRFDARLEWLGAPPRHGAQVHLHLGAAHVMARIFHLPESFVQILCAEPVGCAFGDRFIVRDACARRTLGGGMVVDLFAPARGRARPERLAQLGAQLRRDDPLAALADCSPLGVDLARFAANRNLAKGTGWRFAPRHWRALREEALAALASWHAGHPAAPAMPEDRLAPQLAAAARAQLVDELVREERVVRDAAGVRLAGHRLRLAAADAALWDRLRGALERGGARPPTVAELAAGAGAAPREVERLLATLAREGALVRVSRNRFFLPAALERLERIVLGAQSITAAAFRDRTGLGRGLAIEVLEHFDRARLTRRVGDAHVVRDTTPKPGSEPDLRQREAEGNRALTPILELAPRGRVAPV